MKLGYIRICDSGSKKSASKTALGRVAKFLLVLPLLAPLACGSGGMGPAEDSAVAVDRRSCMIEYRPVTENKDISFGQTQRFFEFPGTAERIEVELISADSIFNRVRIKLRVYTPEGTLRSLRIFGSERLSPEPELALDLDRITMVPDSFSIFGDGSGDFAMTIRLNNVTGSSGCQFMCNANIGITRGFPTCD